MIKVVEKKKIWFSISLTVILVGLVLLFTRGLNFGIDFKGGTKLQVELGEKLDTAALDEIINKYDSSASCKIVNDTQYEIKSTVLDETTSSELLNEIEETFELDDTALVEQNQIGGAVGKELTRKSLIAVGVACIAMLVYIAIRFQLAFGVAAIIALLHDVLITLTVYLVFDINVNTPFIAAMLTIVGYSINDTIVVFDICGCD